MARYQIPPTKTNLIKTRRTLSFAREGYELLDQKRQILVAELMGMMGALLGVWFVILIFFIAPIVGSVVGIISWLVTREHHISYGPFLSMAAVTMLLWGPQIIGWVYAHFYPVVQLIRAGS
jgi:prepilin signal peptidase PulO-like enzyme (type II secretory pathway)